MPGRTHRVGVSYTFWLVSAGRFVSLAAMAGGGDTNTVAGAAAAEFPDGCGRSGDSAAATESPVAASNAGGEGDGGGGAGRA